MHRSKRGGTLGQSLPVRGRPTSGRLQGVSYKLCVALRAEISNRICIALRINSIQTPKVCFSFLALLNVLIKIFQRYDFK